MAILERSKLTRHALPGRMIQKAVGREGLSASALMTMGFAHYSEAGSPTEPNHHAEEIASAAANG